MRRDTNSKDEAGATKPPPLRPPPPSQGPNTAITEATILPPLSPPPPPQSPNTAITIGAGAAIPPPLRPPPPQGPNTDTPSSLQYPSPEFYVFRRMDPDYGGLLIYKKSNPEEMFLAFPDPDYYSSGVPGSTSSGGTSFSSSIGSSGSLTCEFRGGLLIGESSGSRLPAPGRGGSGVATGGGGDEGGAGGGGGGGLSRGAGLGVGQGQRAGDRAGLGRVGRAIGGQGGTLGRGARGGRAIIDAAGGPGGRLGLVSGRASGAALGIASSGRAHGASLGVATGRESRRGGGPAGAARAVATGGRGPALGVASGAREEGAPAIGWSESQKRQLALGIVEHEHRWSTIAKLIPGKTADAIGKFYQRPCNKPHIDKMVKDIKAQVQEQEAVFAEGEGVTGQEPALNQLGSEEAANAVGDDKDEEEAALNQLGGVDEEGRG